MWLYYQLSEVTMAESKTFFPKYANDNISSNVTLVFEDTHQFRAYKGRNYQNYQYNSAKKDQMKKKY